MTRTWLINIRETAKMTQETVAVRSGISRTYYTRIESGDYNVPVETAKRIAATLGFDWTKFYDKA